ncbi:hypothetical protein OR263_29230 [Streptomyces sp. NEAU-H22]|uniref:hypothetical protein n=1 Tax=Streptomyces sp. NEAU-H22 TaxID=2994655 RepID=UPI00225C1697|nr:hypothetical protein [Streptomyces sp. NEAU-H22]MCX3290740.1 hypothetical protein [Streptomyces sp. NEAU-H22]
MLDQGFVDAVQSGRIEPVAAVQAFDGPDVLRADCDPTPSSLPPATGPACTTWSGP